MRHLCKPALIYFIFSFVQVILDTFMGYYNTALVKIMVMIMFTILLNILCENRLGFISWIIVLIPFFFMSLIVSLLLYFVGLKATTGLFT